MKDSKRSWIDMISQFMIPVLTLSGQVAYAQKYPEWGLVLNLMSQPFWIYSAWKSYKEANQIGIFVTSVLFCIITIIGVINYWL